MIRPMKTLALKAVLALFIAGSILTSTAQNISVSGIKDRARTAGAGVAVSYSNGKSTIVWQGQEVWSGKTSAKATARSKVVGDTTYVAAFDGTNVVWENIKGAGAKVK
jgi:hypothetical protein